MSARLRLPEGSLVGFLPILVANLLPIVGVAQFGWDAETLVTTYALEIILVLPLAGLKALFAQQPPDPDGDDNLISPSRDLVRKRGSVRLVEWLPPVYPRALPSVTTVLSLAAWLSALLGLALSEAGSLGVIVSQPTVLLSVAGLLTGQFVNLWRDYIREGRYRELSPHTVLDTAARRARVVVSLILIVQAVTWGARPEAITAIILVTFAGGKLLTEWSAYRTGHETTDDLTGMLAGSTPVTTSETSPETSGTEPDLRVPTDSTAVAWAGASRLLKPRSAAFSISFTLILWLLSLGAVANITGSALALVGVTLVVWLGWLGLQLFEIVAFYLERGTVEYRRYDSTLVAYDSLLGEPQWSASVESLRSVKSLDNRFTDRVLGARRVSVTVGTGEEATERHLGPIADADVDALVEGFELPVVITDREPFGRLTGVTAVLIAGGIVGALFTLTAATMSGVLEVEAGILVPLWFLLPLYMRIPWMVWKTGYPDTSIQTIMNLE